MTSFKMCILIERIVEFIIPYIADPYVPLPDYCNNFDNTSSTYYSSALGKCIILLTTEKWIF